MNYNSPYDDRTDAQRLRDDTLERIGNIVSNGLADAIDDLIDAKLRIKEEGSDV